MKSERQIEILAPAGSKETVRAAVYAGADAVYIGGNRFGARAFADNPDIDGLKEAIDFVHLYGKKLYLTTNTLLADEEFPALYEMVAPLYEHGLDACIVQDIGVLTFLHHHFPDMDLHASTQMTLQSGRAANLLKPFGVTRFVPARELSIQEIRKCRTETDLELEVFVHGALCYCYSGKCLMSSVIGGRSGNRGMCAQPCRLPYTCEEEAVFGEKYLLSPKDVCTLEHIPALVDAGIQSFKIEGRMKKKEYAALNSLLYRKYVDFYLHEGKESFDREVKNPEGAFHRDVLRSMDLFNRGGFCGGYLFETEKSNIIYPAKNGHYGVPVGQVKKVSKREITFMVINEISPQDVLEIRDKKQNSIYEYTARQGAGKGEKVTANILPGSPVKAGDMVYRRRNNLLLKEIENYPSQKIHVSGKFFAKAGEPISFRIKGKDIGLEISCLGEIAEPAKNRPVISEDIKKRLMRTGETSYLFDDITVELYGDLFLPLGKLNELRRQALSMWEKAYLRKFRRSLKEMHEAGIQDFSKKDGMLFDESKKGLWAGQAAAVTVTTKEQFKEVLSHEKVSLIHLPLVYFPKNELDRLLHEINQAGKQALISFPLTGKEAFSFQTKEKTGYLVNSWEMLEYIKTNHLTGNCYGAPDFYATNEEAVHCLKESYGFSDFFTAFDESVPLKKEGFVTVYGCIPVMETKGCIRRQLQGCHNSPKKGFTIKNPKKDEFLVVSHCNYCYNTIYTKQPVHKKESFLKVHFNFVLESGEQVRKVLREWNI